MPQERIAGRPAIIDGDSFEIGETGVRLFGVDAPEGRQSCTRAGSEWACGDEAARKLRSLIGDRTVSCTRRDVDTYGRIVAVCRSGSADLAAEMARSGFATAYRRYSNDYVDEENEARAARRGIWAGEFESPEAYRRDDRREAPAQRSAAASQAHRDATRATSRAISTAKVSASITFPARPPTTTPASTRARASAGSVRKARRAPPGGVRRAAEEALGGLSTRPAARHLPYKGETPCSTNIVSTGALIGDAVERVAMAAPATTSAQSLPNPYRLVDGWAKLPGGREIGAVGDVDIDIDGRHVWAVLRCDAGGDRFGYECLDSDLDVVVKFAPDGNAVAMFGGGHFIWPHGLEVDAQGNVWVTDAASTERTSTPAGRGRGHREPVDSAQSPHRRRARTPGLPRAQGTAPLGAPNPRRWCRRLPG